MFLTEGPSIGLSGREISGPRVYLLIPYPPWGRGVSPRSHVPKENFTSLRNSQILEKFTGFLRCNKCFYGSKSTRNTVSDFILKGEIVKIFAPAVGYSQY